ncbi:MAG: hypothetical protein Q9N02_04365 [Ghiorsea sp.]|nr:hypothetical protein [Ghiorsea sp.]
MRQQEELDVLTRVFLACESPAPGKLPATIELAVILGEKAALELVSWDENHQTKALTQ